MSLVKNTLDKYAFKREEDEWGECCGLGRKSGLKLLLNGKEKWAKITIKWEGKVG